MTAAITDTTADRVLKKTRRDLGWIGVPVTALAGLAGYWLFPEDLGLLTRIAATALYVLSLDLVLGYAGIATLGQAAMFGTGAYAAGIAAVNLVDEPLTLLAIGGVAGGLIALATGALILILFRWPHGFFKGRTA